MKFVSFASSSAGNATLISYKKTNIIIDCGISRKRLIDCLSKYDLVIDDIDYILVTHSHSDHINGLVTLLKNNDIKVLGLKETLFEIVGQLEKNGIKPKLENFKIVRPVNPLNDDSHIKIGDINIYPLKGCHDVPSLYYKFVLGNIKLAILTDMGNYNESVIRNLSDVNYLMLECNYDTELLIKSNRSDYLKSRIAGPGGHLSNIQCCEILSKLIGGQLKKAYLSHISDETNSESYAYQYVTKHFIDSGIKDIESLVFVAKRLEITEILLTED